MKREYPEGPIVGAGTFILDEGRVLLVQRAHEPHKGRWSVPGGVVELGETVREAAAREALEETGLEVTVGEVVAVTDRIVRDGQGWIQYHYVLIDLVARPAGGTLRAGDDAAGARWVGLDELDALDVTEPVGDIARKLLA